jgi:hypothetical protein
MADPQHRIVIGDIDIPFGRLVAFFVKAALAAIPAAIIVWLIMAAMWFVLAMIFGAAFWPRPAF